MNQRLRLKIGENEIEVEGDKRFIEQHLKFFLDKYDTPRLPEQKIDAKKPVRGGEVLVDKSKKILSPAEFVRQKNPQGGREKLIVLAKYLEDYENLSEFKGKDINRVAHQAKIGKIDPSYYPLAVKQGLLNKIKHGCYQLTLTGEDAVLAMTNPQSK